MKSKIEKAKEYATRMHKGQYRKDGKDYIVHPINVANYVRQFKESSELDMLIEAAYLHDTIEDTNATYYDIVHEFGPGVASIVLELTTDEDMKNELGKKRYLQIKLKNMSSCSKEFIEKYKEETIDIIKYLKDNRELSNTHIKIIKEIEKKLEYYN